MESVTRLFGKEPGRTELNWSLLWRAVLKTLARLKATFAPHYTIDRALGRGAGRMMPGHPSAWLLAVVLTAWCLASCASPDHDPALERGSTVVVAIEGAWEILPDMQALDFLPFSPLALSRNRASPEAGRPRPTAASGPITCARMFGGMTANRSRPTM